MVESVLAISAAAALVTTPSWSGRWIIDIEYKQQDKQFIEYKQENKLLSCLLLVSK